MESENWQAKGSTGEIWNMEEEAAYIYPEYLENLSRIVNLTQPTCVSRHERLVSLLLVHRALRRLHMDEQIRTRERERT